MVIKGGNVIQSCQQENVNSQQRCRIRSSSLAFSAFSPAFCWLPSAALNWLFGLAVRLLMGLLWGNANSWVMTVCWSTPPLFCLSFCLPLLVTLQCRCLKLCEVKRSLHAHTFPELPIEHICSFFSPSSVAPSSSHLFVCSTWSWVHILPVCGCDENLFNTWLLVCATRHTRF